MVATKSSFLDKVLGRIGRLDTEGLQTVVQRLARERSFLETLFNTIEDGVLVADEQGRIVYFNQAVTSLIGLQPDVEGEPLARFLPELDWKKISRFDREGGAHVLRHELEVSTRARAFSGSTPRPLDGEASGSSGVALILHDATEARQKTFEAIESERVQALTLLAASVAHEIGNPLNALHIHLQLMEREVKKLKTVEAVRNWLHARVRKMFLPRQTRRKSAPGWSNTSTWPGARSTGWITSSRNSSRRSGPCRRSSNQIRSTTRLKKLWTCCGRNWKIAD